jgi:hypothetical protein
MHGPLPHNQGADRPRRIGVQEGRRASLIQLPRDFGLAGERRGKASENTLLARLLFDPDVVSRKPRPKVVAAPSVTTFLLVDVPCHLKDKWGGHTTRQKN